MLMWPTRAARSFLFVALFLLGAITCICGITFSSSYKRCVADEHQRQAAEKEKSAFSGIGILIRCEAVPLDRHAGALTAVGTFMIAVFTLTLWIVTGNALRLARDEFNSVHRPKIRVRFFPELPVPGSKPMVVTYEIVNIGDVPATILRHELSVYDASLGETTAPRFAAQIRVNKRALASGEISPRYEVPVTMPDVASGEATPVIPANLGSPRVRGRFFYSDANGQVRVTQFYRFYDWESQSFRIADVDSDYQYED